MSENPNGDRYEPEENTDELEDNGSDSSSFREAISLLIEEEDFALRARETELERRIEERTLALANFSNNLRRLHRLATTNYAEIEDLFDDYLKTGCDIFNLSTGIVSQVKDSVQEILAVRSDSNLTVGHQAKYKNTYCIEVIERKKTVAYSHVEKIEQMRQHPAYQNFQLEAFISTPIIVYGVVWGTLSFASTIPRRQGFELNEREIIELMARDIGQCLASRRAQIALKDSEARFRNTFEQAAVGIAHISLEGRFIQVNQGLSEIVAYPVNRIIRMNIQDITYAEDLADSIEFFRQILKGEIETYSGEQRCVRQDGSLVWIHLTISMVQTKSGEPEYFIAVIENIENRKQAEVALQESKEKLQRANLAKDMFIAHVSHELRTPLNSILGFSQIIKHGSNLTPEQLQNIDIVHRCGQHLLTLINDILDFSKIEANKLELETKEFSLVDSLQNTVTIFQLRACELGIEFDYRSFAPLPQIVNGDKTRLQQVLFNLLSNAVKYTQAGKVTFTVGYVSNFEPTTSHCSTKSSLLRFQVEDTGIGIPEDKLTSIFLPFVQLKADWVNQEGTGLGLTIAQNIVRLMDSKLYFESIVNKGSKFWFDLKLSEAKTNDTNSLGTIESSYRLKGKLKQPCKILVVDDNQDNRRLLIDFLQSLGFVVESADNGKTGLAKVKTFKPDAILLDWVMPEMDGKDTIVKIRQQPELQQIKIFIISANCTIVSTTPEIDFQGFLSKPIDLNKLVKLLETNLNLIWKIPDRADPLALSEIAVPAKSELNRLLELAELGDIEAVQQQLEGIATRSSKYAAFVEQTKRIAASFQQHKLIEFIQEFL